MAVDHNVLVLGATGSGVEWGTALFTLITFLILLALLKKYAWGPLKSIMDEREETINKDIDDAQAAKVNAKKLEEENRDILKKTQEEVQTILDDAKHQAKVQQEQIISDANVKANGLIQSAQAEIQQEKQRAIADINNRVSELSVLIASKVINKEISEQDQKELVEKYIKEAGEK
ncbi:MULTISPECIES: F0F1 ATP synthase subunit B [Mammaliicoccus]|uniref:F0F1 ATP synthase subunit B n=1 Tax=Mammaliicoccus TaxID=2803850 RepID=UPI0002D8A67F|nr:MULTISPECIES: F0F1 ATP synthase subunit B [Mammaliicoccus]MCD2477078.1 F0F1 ATP synthase subunit B [Mammaliicoccus lentus]MCD2520190.1 F0F1 ATP synthase subunit B [Mammaliicoccus lentus]MCR1873534.1 F0F1 ATP synthase subunit B [Mammaliicoccus lentus]MDQ7142364.1 F0F1 ATP synthase subunit B [Mammaliicoccus lentus]MEB5685589.1 F0F1 ATP synthase subunit B [Mammaliicoccus lentus]